MSMQKQNAAKELRLKVKLSDDLESELESISALFEHAGDRLSEELLNRISRLFADLATCDLTVTPDASPDVVVLHFPVVWLAELRAIAACANHVD